MRTESETAGKCPLPIWEIWACALAVERQYGVDAPAHIEDRIKFRTRAGDLDGVATWYAIATRYDELQITGRIN